MIQISKATLGNKLEKARRQLEKILPSEIEDEDVKGLMILVYLLSAGEAQLVDEITPTSVTGPAGGCNEIDHLGHGHWVPEEAK